MTLERENYVVAAKNQIRTYGYDIRAITVRQFKPIVFNKVLILFSVGNLEHSKIPACEARAR
jgi:hypothetical protein